jgi:hypothetical protein
MNEAGRIGDEKAPPNRRQSAAGITPKRRQSDCGAHKSAPQTGDPGDGQEMRGEWARRDEAERKQGIDPPFLLDVGLESPTYPMLYIFWMSLFGKNQGFFKFLLSQQSVDF